MRKWRYRAKIYEDQIRTFEDQEALAVPPSIRPRSTSFVENFSFADADHRRINNGGNDSMLCDVTYHMIMISCFGAP